MKAKKLIIQILTDCGYPASVARYLVAVSAHETDNWKSQVYKDNHNLFGMRLPVIRNTTAIGDTDGDGYANYLRNSDSVKDIVYYLRYYSYPLHYDDLFEFVMIMKSHGYFEADANKYYEGVRARYQSIFKKLG